MTRHTIHFDKDLYSKWHRKWENVAMLDIDSVEVCKFCYEPLAMIETSYFIMEEGIIHHYYCEQ